MMDKTKSIIEQIEKNRNEIQKLYTALDDLESSAALGNEVFWEDIRNQIVRKS